MIIVQEIMLKSTDHLRRIIAPVGGQGGVTMSYLCPNCNSFPLEDYVWWVSGRKTTKWWCAICGEKYDWRQPNRLWSCNQVKELSRRKSSKHMRYLRACAQNLINALKLLANQQENGDNLPENIVTNLGKGSTKNLTEGLRDFIKVDSHRALELGEVRRGTGTSKVRLMMASEAWERNRSGRAFGPTWMRWILCVCAVSIEWNMPEKYGPHSVLLFFLIQKPAIVPNSEAVNSFIGDGFLGALFVIGLRGSGDAIAHFLQDWEVQKWP